MKSMTRAFTLIEVLISVVILAVVGTGLLQISINSKQNFAFLKQKSKFAYISSIAFMHNNQKYHNKDMTLYDFLEDDYVGIDDDLRKYLKEYKVHYYHEEYDRYSPFGDTNQTQAQNQTDDEEQLDLTIVFDKIEVIHDKDSAFAYKIYIPIGDK